MTTLILSTWLHGVGTENFNSEMSLNKNVLFTLHKQFIQMDLLFKKKKRPSQTCTHNLTLLFMRENVYHNIIVP